MSTEVIYAVARHDGAGDDAPLLDRLELLSADGVLLLRDAGGRETPCEGTDVVAVISSTPVLREVRAGEGARIHCAPDLAAQLPFVLQPVPGDSNPSDHYVEVNGDPWIAYPTLDEGNVMLPMCDEREPHVEARWAEHHVEAGEWNPLIGQTTIGLATPAVVVEFGWYDHGGIDSGFAVSIRPFVDLVDVFVVWLLNDEVLCGLWGGDSAPSLPVQLFADAAAAKDHRAYWDTRMDEGEDRSYVACASLQLHLSDELIEQVRVALSTRVRQ